MKRDQKVRRGNISEGEAQQQEGSKGGARLPRVLFHPRSRWAWKRRTLSLPQALPAGTVRPRLPACTGGKGDKPPWLPALGKGRH